MYLLSARPKVATIATAGRAASLPFERFGDDNRKQDQRDEGRPIGTIAPPVGFGSFGAPAISEDQVRMVETVTHQPTAEPVGGQQHLLQRSRGRRDGHQDGTTADHVGPPLPS